MRASQRGFTIVELFLVIVTIGILAAVVGPRFFDNRDFDERFYFEEVLSAVRYAQKLAVASGCSIEAQIDNGGYWLSYAENCGDGPNDPKQGDPVADASGGDVQGNNKSDIGIDRDLTVIFNSLGAASSPASVQFADGDFELTVHSTGFIEATP